MNADWRFDWFRVTEEEEKHQHQRSTTRFSAVWIFHQNVSSAVPLLTSLSVVIWTQMEEQGLFWHNKLISEQCHSWLHVTAQNFVVIDKMRLQRVTRDKLITSRRFYSRMLPWNADNAICNQKQWSRADTSKQQTSRPPSLDPQRLKGPYRKVIC